MVGSFLAHFWLISAVVLQIAAAEESPPNSSQTVFLVPSGLGDGSEQLSGIIDLGVVDGGSAVSVEIALVHDLPSKFTVDRVVRTCNCADIKIPKGVWSGGVSNALPAKLFVSVPNVLSQNFRVATLQICNESGVVAKLGIKASIKVPLKTENAPGVVRVRSGESEVQYRFEVLVHKDFAQEELRVTVPDWITYKIVEPPAEVPATDFYSKVQIVFIASLSEDKEESVFASGRHLFSVGSGDSLFRAEEQVRFSFEENFTLFPNEFVVNSEMPIRFIVLDRSGGFIHPSADLAISVEFDGSPIKKTVAKVSDKACKITIAFEDLPAAETGEIIVSYGAEKKVVLFSRH